MIRLQGSSRRGLRFIARSGTLVSAVMLMVSVVSAVHAGAALVLPAGGAPTPGQQMQANNSTSGVTNGVQDTPFALSYDGDNACAGDSAAGGYRVNSFMVPASVDASQLEYGSTGPTAPAGVAFSFPLFAGNVRQVNKNTAPTTGIITAGNLLQPFSFAALVAGNVAVPNGEYKIGLACTVLGVTDEYWETTIAVTDSTTGPVTFAWEVTESSTTTTSSSSTSTTTTIHSTSSSTSTSTTSTTSTTTTAAPSATATTIAFVSVTGSLPSVGSQAPASSGSGTFPVTGSSPVPIAIWAILLLVFGRMAILLARPLKVVPASSR